MGISKLTTQLLSAKDCLDTRHRIGGKTGNLAKLAAAGLAVPPFVAIPAELCVRLMTEGKLDRDLAGQLSRELQQILPAKQYAVRSSALTEDSANSSMAGQFHTETAVAPEKLVVALEAVLQQAEKFLRGDLSQFSVLIQEYIAADFSGVLFTRDPGGRPETVLEYHAGAGENLVSGKITPITVRFFPAHVKHALSAADRQKLPGLPQQIERFMQTEKLFAWPQDIEWCVSGGKWYFLQSRPITTLSKEQYQQHLFLEDLIPTDREFLWEKNEISEIAPVPLPFTWSLLEEIYASDGPVARVYSKHRIKYQPRDFLLRVGNELFVDRELELHTLLPAFSYFVSGDGLPATPRWYGWKGLGRSLKNWWKIMRTKTDREKLLQDLKVKLQTATRDSENLVEAWQHFLQDYALIFEINLFADKALKNLKLALAKEPVLVAQILAHQWPFVEEVQFQVTGSDLWKGNSLEINDFSPFAGKLTERTEVEAVKKWWQSVPSWKLPYWQKIITETVNYMRLREYGRFLTVKNINMLRTVVLARAKQLGFDSPQEIFFTGIEDIKNGVYNEQSLLKAKEQYEKLATYSFPARLSSRSAAASGKSSGVSSGRVSGKLVILSQKDAPPDMSGAILYTRLLTPDLTKYFGQIAGIVSEEGGLLSHLAIMARENHLPVVVGFNLSESGLEPGEMLSIDGDSGEVKKL